MSPQLAAKIFAALVGLVVAFQLALGLGAPWGEMAMGGAFPGAFSPAMRAAAVLQALVLAACGVVVLSGAGVVLPRWRALSRRLLWPIVGLFVVAAVLNLITPSAKERMIWSPVAVALLITSLRVAWAGRGKAQDR